MHDFSVYMERVLGHEGGYVNLPADPGGETQWGIAKRSYPNVDIKALTREEAIAIYHRDFWGTVDGDQLPSALAFQALDAAVNHGVGTAVRWLQRAAGVADDGHFGPVSLAAVKAADPSDMVLKFLSYRLDFYTRLATFPTFGKGWVRRLAGNLLFAAQDN